MKKIGRIVIAAIITIIVADISGYAEEPMTWAEYEAKCNGEASYEEYKTYIQEGNGTDAPFDNVNEIIRLFKEAEANND